LKKIIKKLLKITKKNHQKNLPGLAKKIFFSNQTKNKCKLIFNQNKKKIIFFWDLVKKNS
jgi:phage regulator Rha-like protein